MSTDNYNKCVNMNVVSEKYVVPQAQAFGLSWSMPMDRGYSPRCTEECHRTATGWRSAPDPTNKMMDVKDQVVFPAQALELMSGIGGRKWQSARQDNGLQLNQTKRAQAR